VDILVPAGNAGTDDSIDVVEWKALVQRCRSSAKVFPGTDSGIPRMTESPEQSPIGPEPAPHNEMLKSRGLGARYWGEGADGMYIFNFHQGYQVNKSMVDGSYRFNRELLTELGSAQSLDRLDKLYVATQRVTKTDGAWQGAFDVDREFGQVPVPVLPTFSQRGAVVRILLGPEDCEPPVPGGSPPCEVTLRLRLEQWTHLDSVEVRWDGQTLPVPPPPPRAGAIIEVDFVRWLEFPLGGSAGTDLSAGSHQVEVILLERNPQVTSPITLTDVEVLFDYGAPPTCGRLPSTGAKL
jgi:hypothetical protein